MDSKGNYCRCFVYDGSDGGTSMDRMVRGLEWCVGVNGAGGIFLGRGWMAEDFRPGREYRCEELMTTVVW